MVLRLLQQLTSSERTSHKRPRCDRSETHRVSIAGPDFKLLRRNETVDGQIALARFAWRKVLAEREHIDVRIAEPLHGVDDFIVGLAESDHDAAFRIQVWSKLFRPSQNLQTLFENARIAHPPVEPGHALQ